MCIDETPAVKVRGVIIYYSITIRNACFMINISIALNSGLCVISKGDNN
jgi:hypothetical protein